MAGREEEVVTYFNLLTSHSPVGQEKTKKNLRSDFASAQNQIGTWSVSMPRQLARRLNFLMVIFL
jgi:hypothetical protein